MCTFTALAGSPVMLVTVGMHRAWPWVGAQISADVAVTTAVQFITSIVAWAR